MASSWQKWEVAEVRYWFSKSYKDQGQLEELGMRDKKKLFGEWDRCLRVVHAVGDGKQSSQTDKM